jgi:3-methyl-2-oxobutanoate hydroxymethyltransferase
MVVLGHPNTLSVTMDEMLHHARAVSRGAQRPLLIGDMPFLSYQADRGEAVRNAGRFLAEAGMDAVKLEGGRRMAETVRAIVDAGIPVQGHIGLLPQSEKAMGGLRVQGRTAAAAMDLLHDAQALEESGCFSIVIEGVPARVSAEITARVGIPTIGIGAGPDTDGQVLVMHDILGLYERTPRFARRYADLGAAIDTALRAYCGDVRERRFPAPEHTYAIPEDEWAAFEAELHRPRPRLPGRRSR